MLTLLSSRARTPARSPLAATVPMALRGRARGRELCAVRAPRRVGRPADAASSMLYGGDAAAAFGLWSEALQHARADQRPRRRMAARTRRRPARWRHGCSLPANGARVAMIETGGWDTHAGQRGRLAAQLKGLGRDAGGAQGQGLGPVWSDTLVVVATEFGRTVAVNGTGGTDHGTASAAMLFGGAVRGGRVVADWPGLSRGQLYEARDLRPTTGLDAVIAGAVAQHYAVDPGRALPTLFPGAGGGRALEGLLA